MNEEKEDKFLLLLADAVNELISIRKALQKFVNEGITIYMHQDGDENKN